MKRGVSFTDALLEVARSRDLVEQYDRLTGSNLSRRGTGLDLAIDDESGRTDAEIEAFVAFVFEFVWIPLVGDQEVERGR